MAINNSADTLNAALTFDGHPITFAAPSVVSFLGGFGVNNTTAISAATSQSLSISAGTTLSMTSNDAMTINGAFSTTITTAGNLLLQSTAASITMQSSVGGFTIECATLGRITSTSNIQVISTDQLVLQSTTNGFALTGNTDSTISSSAGSVSLSAGNIISATAPTINLNASTGLNTNLGYVNFIAEGMIYIYAMSANNITLEGGQIQVIGQTFAISTSEFTITTTLPSAGSASATGAFIPTASTQQFLVFDSADNQVKLYAGH